jgi:ketosteroid isomerase-like protein
VPPGSRVRACRACSVPLVTADDSDVALVRRAFEDFDVREGSLEDYFERYYLPDGVIEFVDGFPVPGLYRGIDGYRRWFEDSYGPYQDVRRRLDSIQAEGDLVVALVTISGRPKDEDLDLEVQVGNTYELEGGRIRHLRVYVGHERALEAARAEG